MEYNQLTNLSLVSLMSSNGVSILGCESSLEGNRLDDISSKSCIILFISVGTFEGAKGQVDINS